MKNNYIELLMVKTDDQSMHLVKAPAHEAFVGSLVRFAGGKLGEVVKKAWMQENDEVHQLFAVTAPIFDAEAIYRPQWSKEAADAAS